MAGPQFVSPGAMASNAIAEFLMQREQQEMERVRAALLQQRQEEESRRAAAMLELQQRTAARQDQQFEADEEQRRIGNERTAAQDALAMEDRRRGLHRESEQSGVRRMAFEGVRGGGYTPEQAVMMAGEQGLSIPIGVLDPGRETRLASEQDERNHQQAIELARIQGEESRRTVALNNQPRTAGAPTNPYAERTESRLLTALDNLESMIGPDTVGTGKAKLLRAEPFLPGDTDPTVDFDAALEQIRALIGFNELNAMRQSSPTGGALGNITEKELSYLQSVMGNLNPNQSAPAFKAQIAKIRADIQRVVDYGLGGMDTGRASGAGPTSGPPAGGVIRWGRDANGRPVRLGP